MVSSKMNLLWGPNENSHQKAETGITCFHSTVADLGEDALRVHTPFPTFFFFFLGKT